MEQFSVVALYVDGKGPPNHPELLGPMNWGDYEGVACDA